MTWDLTTPAGTEAINNGDDRIREFKTDVQTALRGNATDGDEAIFPGSDTVNPIYRYRGLKGSTAARPTAGQYGLYMNITLNTIQRDSGSAWEDVATLIPSGTVMVFFQSAAPTGWTKSTSHNDKALRVVSGTGGGSGGSAGFGGIAAASHVLTLSEIPSHTHSFDVFSVAGGGTAAAQSSSGSPVGVTTGTAGTGGGHTHSIDPLYIDVIIASKD